MKIYENQDKWKVLLIVFGGLMLMITLIYSNYLAGKLRENEQKNASLLLSAMIEVNKSDPDGLQQNLGIIDSIIQNFNLPVIFEDETGFLQGHNFTETEEPDSIFLENKKSQFLSSGREPLEGIGYSRYIYYFNSSLLGYIKYYPLVQLLLVGLFIGLGYFIFNVSRRAEQNRVWAGMAKETAHQLGTPITAIMAWIEHLKEYNKGDEAYSEIMEELDKDVNRLDLVADRFSKIGSKPELVESNLYVRIVQVSRYMKRRASSKISFHYPEAKGNDLRSMINEHLFDWVIENLMRNSLDAMGNEGEISTHLFEQDGYCCIDITDTGKGIPSSKFNSVFKPGYSTKKRGWGLGLSLAKRIITEYHDGKIYVKESKIDKGTTFAIRLPKIS